MLDKDNGLSPDKEIRVLEIVGGFLMFFGILLLIGVARGRTASDQVVNLVSAAVLLAIGFGMFWRGVVRHRGAWLLPVALFSLLAVVAAVAAFCVTSLIPEEREELTVVEETQEEPQEVKPAGEPSFFVKGLRRIGGAMRDVVESIPLSSVRLLAVIAFGLIAIVVWFVRRTTVFEGVVDGRWWRDLRLWTLVVVATQVVIYLLLGA